MCIVEISYPYQQARSKSSHSHSLRNILKSVSCQTKDIRLFKGGIPALYGGRVSSVLNIYQKEGNKNEFKSQGGLGLISSRLLLEGPIKKGKSSFLIEVSPYMKQGIELQIDFVDSRGNSTVSYTHLTLPTKRIV